MSTPADREVQSLRRRIERLEKAAARQPVRLPIPLPSVPAHTFSTAKTITGAAVGSVINIGSNALAVYSDLITNEFVVSGANPSLGVIIADEGSTWLVQTWGLGQVDSSAIGLANNKRYGLSKTTAGLLVETTVIGRLLIETYDSGAWSMVSESFNVPSMFSSYTTITQTTSGTVDMSGYTHAIVYAVGGGGGGGDHGSSPEYYAAISSGGAVTAGLTIAGGGGGGGGAVLAFVRLRSLTASLTVTIGAGGATNTAGGSGTAGGSTQVNAPGSVTITADGGGAGGRGSTTTWGKGGAGGRGTVTGTYLSEMTAQYTVFPGHDGENGTLVNASLSGLSWRNNAPAGLYVAGSTYGFGGRGQPASGTLVDGQDGVVFIFAK